MAKLRGEQVQFFNNYQLSKINDPARTVNIPVPGVHKGKECQTPKLDAIIEQLLDNEILKGLGRRKDVKMNHEGVYKLIIVTELC